MVNVMRAVLSALLALAGIAAAAPDAKAAPPTVPWSGQAAGDAARVDLNLAGEPALAGVRLANGESTASSTSTPRVSSVTRNVAAAPLGLGFALQMNDQTAPPDNAAPETGTMEGANALGISVGAVSFSNEAHWAGDDNCMFDVLADTTTGTVGLGVSPAGVPKILTTGASSTSALVRLVSTGGIGLNRAVQSRAVGTLDWASLLGGAVTVDIDGEARLTATAAGTPDGAGVTYEPPVVTVTVGGTQSNKVEVGQSRTVDVQNLGSVDLTVNTPTQQADPAGFGASASVAVVSVAVRLGPADQPLGTASVDLLPLTVSAAVAAGGVDCPPPAPTVDTPAAGAVLDDATPSFTGTGTPGATVEVIIDGATAGGAPVDGNGDWTYTPTAPLADGPHTVSATQSLNGVTSAESGGHGFLVDPQPPAAPVITAPADGSTSDDNTPTVTGTGEPGATVTVRKDGDVVDTATVDGTGSWQLPPPTEPLADGTYTLSATQTDQAGNTSAVAEVDFTIDTEARPPVIVKPAEGSRGNATPIVAGTGEPGATVIVRVDRAVVGTAPVHGDGTWDLALTTRLADGEHKATATQTDEAGNTSPPDEVGFAVDTKTPPPSITDPADGSTTTDNTPTIAGTAEPHSRVILFVDGRPVGSVVTDAEGNWRLTLKGKLPDGEHEISAIAVDPAGNESAVNAIMLTIDTSDDGSGPGSWPVLARTGGPQLAVAVVTALLLTGGGVLLSVRRRILGR